MLNSETVTLLPSTSKLTLNSLPDDAIYSILKQIKSSNEVQKLKGVSKRFRRIIHNRGYGLSRPKIDSLRVSFDFPQIPQKQIGKLRLVPSSSSSPPPKLTFNINLFKANRQIPFKHASHLTEEMECPKKLSPQMFDSLETALKKFSFNSTLEFNRIFIDKNFVKHFLRPFSDIKNVETLKFYYCTFDLTAETLINLFLKTKCKEIEVIYCNGAEKVCNDTLLTSINSLESLRIQATSYQPIYNISNKTLEHWMSSFSSLPTKIDLINCQTFLTPLNLSTFLNFTYKNLKQTSMKQVLYDFGYISAHPFDVKQFFILNNGFERDFSKSDNALIQFKSTLINRFDDGFETTPELSFFMSFLKSKLNLKNSKFEINFILNCEALQTIFVPKNDIEKLYKFNENKLKIICY